MLVCSYITYIISAYVILELQFFALYYELSLHNYHNPSAHYKAGYVPEDHWVSIMDITV